MKSTKNKNLRLFLLTKTIKFDIIYRDIKCLIMLGSL